MMWRIIGLVGLIFWSLEAIGQVQIDRYPVAPLYPDGSKMCDGIVVDNELILVGGEGVILRSHDGFQTWQRQRLKDGEYRTIYSIAKLDSRVWVVVGESGLCYRTTDGGEHWQAVDVGTDRTLYRVRQDSSGVVIAVGEGGVIVRSTDGGMRWEERASGTEKGLRGLGWRGDEVVVVGERGVIVRSTDRGESWAVVQEGDALGWTLYDVAATPSHWYAVGDGMVLARSSDGGGPWQTRTLVPPRADSERLRGIWFADGQQGWIVGESESTLWQPVWETTDGGQSWQKVQFRIDTVQVGSGVSSWQEYPIIWWGIRVVEGRRIVYGERSQYTIVAAEPQVGGTEWYRRVWDRIVSLSPIAGAKLEGCDRFLALLGYPSAPQLVRYDGRQWDTVSLLPVIDVWRDTILPQFQYHGERPQHWVWNGASVFVWSWYTNGWWSADSGKTWEIVPLDSIRIDQVVPYGDRGFAILGGILVPGSYKLKPVCLVSPDIGQPWREVIRLDTGQGKIVKVRFFDSLRAIALIWKETEETLELRKTTDGGRNWEQQSLPFDFDYYAGGEVEVFNWKGVEILDEQRIVCLLEIVVWDNGAPQYLDAGVVTSSDGGQRWTSQWWYTQLGGEKARANIGGAMIAKSLTNIVVMLAGGTSPGTLIYTRDGQRWQKLRLPEPGQGRQVFDDNGSCAIVWQGGDPFSNNQVAPKQLLVLHFAVTGVEEAARTAVQGGVAVYPTPARETVFFHYSDAIGAQIREIRMYTQDGRLIRRYPGRVEQIPVSDLPAGTYYVVINQQSGISHLVVFQVLR